MTDTLDTRSIEGVYLEHYQAAEQLLGLAERWADQGTLLVNDPEGAYIAIAQVHATLAHAVATTRLVDSYNGWKDLGR